MSIGMLLISVELLLMLCILLFIPGDYAGSCFIGFAIGESLGAAALRIAGGIFTKIADIGADLMKIVFNIKEDDARNPGVIADCTGDNAGDSVGPSADGFETYGVTGVALISFILLAVTDPVVQVQLLVWIFVMRVIDGHRQRRVLSAQRGLGAKASYDGAETMNFETPLTTLVWLTSIRLGGADLRGVVLPDPRPGRRPVPVVEAVDGHHLRHAGRRDHPGAGQGLHLDRIGARPGSGDLVARGGRLAEHPVRLGGGQLQRLLARHGIVALMAIAYGVSTCGLGELMLAPAVFAFGLVAFGFLGMGPVTIAVDSYGPVTDNAQSVYELSMIESIPNIAAELKRDYGFDVNFERAKHLLEENDGAGNTFKATAKPVLIGTAVVGATTMIFSIIVVLTHRLQPRAAATICRSSTRRSCSA